MAGKPIRRPRLRESLRNSPGGFSGADSPIADMQALSQSAAFVQRGTDSTPLDSLAVAFWASRLRTIEHHHDGDELVDYESLWPSGPELERAIKDFNESDLAHALLDCCRLTVLCGPVRVLRALLEAKIVGVDQMFQPHGVTLMHMACVAQIPEMVGMLKEFEPSYKKDLLGRTAEGLCRDRATRIRFSTTQRFSGAIKRAGSRAGSAVAKAIAKCEVFQMATEPMKCVEVLVQIQNLDFDVNTEKDDDGNFLVHVLVECGIAQMPALLCLQRLHKADFNIHNDDGMTPLCIAAQDGSPNLIELLICVLGASPNKPNGANGWTPLHYAASQCQPDAVLALLRRGALVSLECNEGSLPDDIMPRSNPDYRETLQLLQSERQERMERLTLKARNGTLYWKDVHKSDQFVINDSFNTLLMEAAMNDCSAVVSMLCDMEAAPINAQHCKTGQTAVSMCCAGGHIGSLQQLLKHGADPRIVDINGMIALQHACRWRSIDCISELVKRTNGLYGLGAARQYTNDETVLTLLDQAQQRRQDEIIRPMLFECVVSGDLEKLGAFEWEDEDDVNVLNSDNEWPILLAAQNGHTDVIRMLHKLGGHVNRKFSQSTSTPLHAACKYGRLAVVDFLLNFTTCGQRALPGKAGAAQSNSNEDLMDINTRDSYGHTALELAVSQGKAKIIEQLVKIGGASCTIPDSGGHLLSSPQFPGVQVMLKDYRIQHMQEIVNTFSKRKDFISLKQLWMSPHDHSLRNENEESPLMVACSSVARMDVINYLLSDVIPQSQSTDDLAQNRPMAAGNLPLSPPHRNRRSSTPVPSSLLSPRGKSTPDSGGRTRRIGAHEALLPPGQLSATRQSLEPLLDEDETEASPSAARRKLSFDRSSSSHSGGSSNGSAKDNHKPGGKTSQADLSGFDSLLDRPPSPVEGPTAKDIDDSRHFLSQLSASESDLSISMGSLHTLPWREPLSDLLLARGRDGGTALHRAVAASFFNAAKAIIEADQRIINIADNRGNMPIHLACVLKQNKIIKLLLNFPTIVLNVQNADYQLPEDLAPKSLSKMISQKRMALTNGTIKRPSRRVSSASSVSLSELPSPPPGPDIRPEFTGSSSTPGADSLDLAKLEEQFSALKDRNGSMSGRLTPKPSFNREVV